MGTSPPVRNFTRVALAIIAAAVVISAATLSYSSFETTVTKTSTSISTVTSNVTSILTITTTPGLQLYNVTFTQAGACSPAVYAAPWSVTLNGTTKVEPPYGTVSTGGGYSAGPEPASVFTIAFSVPNGVYQYIVAPQGAFYTYQGTVTVNGSDTSVVLEGPTVSCTTTTGTG